MTEASFPDHFSSQAGSYQLYRPGYPDDLFSYLASLAEQTDTAWDCATGSGQAAVKLAEYFSEVMASDASQVQINNATAHDKVKYRVCPAEQTPFDDQSVNLVTVAQALHWFKLDKFYQEVNRVLKPDGIIAIWTYNLMKVIPEIDALIDYFYGATLGQYWPFERKYIENGYQDLAFPFTELSVPEFFMTTEWSMAHLLGYLSTWSAVQQYKKNQGHDPLQQFAPELVKAWGDQTLHRTISWPLTVRVGRSQSG